MGPLSIFDIIGPVMIGPSSSHTAGALKIGLEMHHALEGSLSSAQVTLYNSFADTGEGHGTKIAIVAGLLGHSTEYGGIKSSLVQARLENIDIEFVLAHDEEKHPNSVRIVATTSRGTFCAFGESLGGGIINFELLEMAKGGKLLEASAR